MCRSSKEGNTMERYEPLEMETIRFDEADVITGSNDTDTEYLDGIPNPIPGIDN